MNKGEQMTQWMAVYVKGKHERINFELLLDITLKQVAFKFTVTMEHPTRLIVALFSNGNDTPLIVKIADMSTW